VFEKEDSGMGNSEEVGTETDLATQFEALLAAVWAAEQNWRFDDRIALSVKMEQRRRPNN
jgi:hypothetical protein